MIKALYISILLSPGMFHQGIKIGERSAITSQLPLAQPSITGPSRRSREEFSKDAELKRRHVFGPPRTEGLLSWLNQWVYEWVSVFALHWGIIIVPIIII